MKKLACPFCGEIYEVSDSVEEVICASCLIAGEGPVKIEGKIRYWRHEAYKRLVNLDLDNGDALEEKFWDLKEQGLSLSKIRKKLTLPLKEVQKFEVKYLRDKGLGWRTIAKKLGITHTTAKRWYSEKCSADPHHK